ncbi:hypothetical protein BA78_8884 [Aspergillus fumigatus]|nr:hypothetical protein BA78_8884 [Aspergillus fumigatus]
MAQVLNVLFYLVEGLAGAVAGVRRVGDAEARAPVCVQLRYFDGEFGEGVVRDDIVGVWEQRQLRGRLSRCCSRGLMLMLNTDRVSSVIDPNDDLLLGFDIVLGIATVAN